jgi:hypothetical protein
MVHRQPEGDVAAAIMSKNRKLIMSQLRHQLCKIIGHRALGLLTVIIAESRFARPPIATHVRADHAEAGCRQAGCNPVPSGRCPGMTMDKEERRTVTTTPHTKLHVPEVDHLVAESLEHWSPPAGAAWFPEVERAFDCIGPITK